jgi:hypothetical protein
VCLDCAQWFTTIETTVLAVVQPQRAVWLYNLRIPRPIPVVASMHEESKGARAAQATRAALGEPGNEGSSGLEIELASDLWGPSRIVIESPTEELA